MRFGPLAAGVLMLLVGASAVHAQAVTVEFVNGQVNLRAQNATARAILAEWARRGGTTIVNGDRIAGAPLTLELTGVTERQALDIVLRGVAGYMLAPRRAGTSGVSMFDRILILPTSVAPRAAGPAPTPSPAALGAARPVVPQPRIVRQPPPVAVPQPEPEDAADDVAEDPATDQPVPGTRPTPPRIVRPGLPPQPLGPEPQVVAEEPEEDDADDPPPTAAPTPGNPFGVPAGSGRPGVIAPVPQQPQQQRPPGQQR
jgi:hypothetical protein